MLHNKSANGTKPADTEEFPDLLALIAAATANLAAAGCELTLPGGKGSCDMPTVSGDCCTFIQDSVDPSKKGEMMGVLKGMSKGQGGKARVNTCMQNIKGDMGLIAHNQGAYCTKPADTEEFPDFLALGAAATANMAADGCELTLPGGKGSCDMPTVSGECCTFIQDSVDPSKKGEMMGVLKGMSKGQGGKARVNTCMQNIKGDMGLIAHNQGAYCTKPADTEEFPDFLALGAAATANLASAGCEVTLPGGKGSCHIPTVSGLCCTWVQAVTDHSSKGAMKGAFEKLKGQGKARFNTCIQNFEHDRSLLMKHRAEYCTTPADTEEFLDFLALASSVKEALTEAQEPNKVQDDATEDGSQIMTGLWGFVAGAAVTALGASVLRRRTPSQDEYNEIVA